MKISCPNCRNTFEADFSGIAASTVKLICETCKSEFVVDADAAQEEETTSGQARLVQAPTSEVLIQTTAPPEKTPVTEQSTEIAPSVKRAGSGKKCFAWSVLVILALFVAGGTYWWTQQRVIEEEPRMAVAEEVVVTPIPAPTSSPANVPEKSEAAPAKRLPQAGVAGTVQFSEGKESKPAPAPPATKKVREIPPKFLIWYREFTPTSLGKLREALLALPQAEVNNDKRLALMLADLHAYLGRREKRKPWMEYAFAVAHSFHRKNPQGFEENRSVALALISARQFGKARSYAEKVIRMERADGLGAYVMAMAETKEESTAQGIGIVQKAHARYPQFFPLAESLAGFYLEQRRFPEAEKLIRIWTAREGNDFHLQRMLIRSLEAQGKWAEVADRASMALDLNSGAVLLRLPLARALRQMGKLKEADRELATLQKRMGDLLLSEEERGWISLERGKVAFDLRRFGDSVPHFQTALRFKPSDFETLLFLGGAFFHLKQFKGAANAYSQAHAVDPQHGATRRYLARSLMEIGKPRTAEKHLKGLMSEGIEDAPLLYLLSRAREAQGDVSGAIAYLERALVLNPEYKNAQIRLGKLQQK